MNESDTIPVMLVDDSSIIRALLREVLNEDGRINAGAYASNGKLALPRIRHYKPRIVILDYEMPEMDGLETLKVIRREHPEISVIMFSSHTVAGAKVTLEALEIGASDFVPKPEFSENSDPRAYIRTHLIPRIIALAGAARISRGTSAASGAGSGLPPASTSASTSSSTSDVIAGVEKSPGAPIARVAPATTPLPGKFNICAIGISTGGPVALKELLGLLPANLNGSLLITQHMPPLFTEQLALSLNQSSPLTVQEAQDGQPVKRGNVYIAPGSKHMLLRAAGDRLTVSLDDSPPYMHCKPSVNRMYSSLVKLMPRKTLTVIMTGMGSDGTEGIQDLHAAGSYIMAQSRESCVVFGMPAGPTESGLASESHDIKGLAEKITYYLGVA